MPAESLALLVLKASPQGLGLPGIGKRRKDQGKPGKMMAVPNTAR
jgi:hypothetical protein